MPAHGRRRRPVQIYNSINVFWGKLAHLTRESSNRLFEILEDWSHVLRYTRLGKEVAEKAKNGKDGSAPRDNHPVAVRRRKTA